ncbi:Germanicol synthase [Vitis vinifera]|uniref:Germanicol synthase n=1 Tax=Vitis vinifera TaxID=29760 RepID=A0A438FSB3_VITVI|nr:Germanicol synthase [Vitis vinifera]
MWRLKVADGGNDPYIYSTNNFVGRQIWEFDPDYGTTEERAEVEAARENFWKNRFQFLREKNFKQTIPQVKVGHGEEITYETTTTAVRRAAHFFSALQASDGHWPAENSGPLFLLPPLGILILYSLENIVKKSFASYSVIRMKMADGDFMLKDTAPCIVQCTTIFVCVILGVGPDDGQGNACPRGENGSLTMVVQPPYPLGGRRGFRYLAYMSGQDAIQCPQSFGCFLLFFLYIQV